MASLGSLIHARSLEKVSLEFTTRCNLKCTYCAVTRPWTSKLDLDLSHFDELVDEMKALGVKYVGISGGGETTIVKDWDRYLERLLDAGMQITIISNLAKPFTPRMIRALSKCIEITNSCDTVDPELYAAIRRGGDFAALESNIRQIRECAQNEGRPVPRFIWNMVGGDCTISRCDEWVAKGLELGIDHFQISELFKYWDQVEGRNLRPVGVMSDDELAQARAAVERARALAQQAGKWFAVLPAVEAALAGNRRVTGFQVKAEQGPDGKWVLSENRTTVFRALDDGTVVEDAPPPAAVPAPEPALTPPVSNNTTKNCLMPWKEAFIWASGEVVPCCMYKRVGSLDGFTLHQALNSEWFQRIREGLLTGNLTKTCNLCPMYGPIDIDEFRKRVEEVVASDSGADDRFSSSAAPVTP